MRSKQRYKMKKILLETILAGIFTVSTVCCRKDIQIGFDYSHRSGAPIRQVVTHKVGDCFLMVGSDCVLYTKVDMCALYTDVNNNGDLDKGEKVISLVHDSPPITYCSNISNDIRQILIEKDGDIRFPLDEE